MLTYTVHPEIGEYSQCRIAFITFEAYSDFITLAFTVRAQIRGGPRAPTKFELIDIIKRAHLL